MSELPPPSLQMNIDRDGGLYDQAAKEDVARTIKKRTSSLEKAIDRNGGLYDQAVDEDVSWVANRAKKEAQDTVFASYQANVDAVVQREQAERTAQDDAYATYGDNITSTQLREQNEAYRTYASNIQTAENRKQNEYIARLHELKQVKKKRNLMNIGAIAMWVPGLDIAIEMTRESLVSRKINKETKRQYGSSSLVGDIKDKFQLDKRRNKEQTRIIEDLSDLISQYEQERSSR